MTPQDIQKIKDAFNSWAANHDEPDKATAFMGDRSYSPRQWADEIINETPFGKDILRFHEAAMRETGQTIEEHCAWINPRKPKSGG
jgi:hypothetical protein